LGAPERRQVYRPRTSGSGCELVTGGIVLVVLIVIGIAVLSTLPALFAAAGILGGLFVLFRVWYFFHSV
jgi:hypothetical protein